MTLMHSVWGRAVSRGQPPPS